MTRFDNVMKKFGVTQKNLGVTSHGLRHEGLINDYEKLTGEAPPYAAARGCREKSTGRRGRRLLRWLATPEQERRART